MRINHNIASLNTYRQLSTNNALNAKSLEKLSSGLRINRAGDDAAGLAISEKMRGQIRGLDQATRNAQDGISLIQTAEGALNETHSILQRMRELAVQAANDTNTQDDRNEIQKEINQLIQEVDRISNTTEFNTRKLLNGESGAKVIWQNNSNLTWASASENTPAGTFAIQVTTAATQASFTGGAVTGSATSGTATITIGGHDISFTYVNGDAATSAANFIAAVNNANIGITASGDASGITLTSNQYGTAGNFIISANAYTADLKLTVDASTNRSVTGIDIAGTIGGQTAQGSGLTLTGTATANLGLAVTLTSTAGSSTGAKGSVVVTQNALTMHIGANENQSMTVNISSMAATDLGISSVSVASQTAANSSITTIDNAIKIVSAERSKLGAYQNRLEHTINNLGTSSENLSAAESRIRDVDMAKEMMEYTKMSILSQAATAMLAQANQQPQLVLQLLR